MDKILGVYIYIYMGQVEGPARMDLQGEGSGLWKRVWGLKT